MTTQELNDGQRVRLAGLEFNVAYNEREGVLESWCKKTNRWVVVVGGTAKFKVKPGNLQPLVSENDTSVPPESATGAREPEREPDVPVPDVRTCLHVQVENHERSEANGVTYFSIVVSLPDGSNNHTVQHRYTDIRNFRDGLEADQCLRDGERSAPFPKKAMLCKGQRLEERRRQLERWLQQQLPEAQSFDNLDARWRGFLRIDAQAAAQ